MKERPILFSASMVSAILDGSKSQTRRIVKGMALDWLSEFTPEYVAHPENSGICPFGTAGDRLWVREAWRIGAWNEDEGEVAIDYLADGLSRREWIQVPEESDFERYWIQCTDDAIKAGLETDDNGMYHWEPGQSPCRGRPSIHMPRWASRINLEITGVRVERLQDISEADAEVEGVDFIRHIPDADETLTAQQLYECLWESINGPGSWELNQWVWVIEFKRVTK